jgi:hypothetical protein
MLSKPLTTSAPLNCRGRAVSFSYVFIFVLALKRASPYVLIQSNQRSSQQKGFFAAQCLCPANQSEPRAGIFCPASPAHFHLFCKSSYAPATRGPPLFCPLSPEAVLLTRKKILQSLNQANQGSENALGIKADTSPCLRPV